VPVVRIRALPQPSADIRTVTAAVAGALATELGEDPRGTWATWETVDVYAEGPETPALQPPDTHPPLATVLGFEGRAPDLIERIIRCVGDTLARELGLEADNVFVTYEEVGPGRLYEGGEIRG
jgi:phenylpyruvate tautomerase PptA (4-oxalocrotonate tautomerase family)